MPTTRANRHGGDSANVGYSAPTELYSNSTVALNPDTGALQWYYQHLPGDDWDLDMNEERIVLETAVNPDPAHVRWINPNIARGSTREVVVNVGEGGGLWLLDKYSGEFIWATPFPFDVSNFFLSQPGGSAPHVRDHRRSAPGTRDVLGRGSGSGTHPASRIGGRGRVGRSGLPDGSRAPGSGRRAPARVHRQRRADRHHRGWHAVGRSSRQGGSHRPPR
jgi:hypothetical protein